MYDPRIASANIYQLYIFCKSTDNLLIYKGLYIITDFFAMLFPNNHLSHAASSIDVGERQLRYDEPVHPFRVMYLLRLL